MTPEQLARELSVFATWRDDCTGTLAKAAAELGRLTDENAALKADAERYRWLRNHNPTKYAFELGADISDINSKEDGQNELDAAIDIFIKAAIKETP